MQIDSALSEETKITRRDVTETLKDWKLWYVLIFNILASVPPQAFGVFLPLVVKVTYYSTNTNRTGSRLQWRSQQFDVCPSVSVWRFGALPLRIFFRSIVTSLHELTNISAKSEVIIP
jgi:hypothetical protein